MRRLVQIPSRLPSRATVDWSTGVDGQFRVHDRNLGDLSLWRLVGVFLDQGVKMEYAEEVDLLVPVGCSIQHDSLL